MSLECVVGYPKKKELVQESWDEVIFPPIIQQIIHGLKNNPNSDENKKGIDLLKQKSKDPDTINVQTLIEGFENPNIKLKVNPHSSNEVLITGMCDGGIFYYLESWSIIHNSTTTPFITSDNPVCSMEYPHPDNPNIMLTNMYAPLTPKLAILIHITRDKNLQTPIKESFYATENIVKEFNSTIVKFADNLVIANMEADWIKIMVDKFKDHQEYFYEQVVMTGADEG